MKISIAFETVVFDRLHLAGGQVIPAGTSFELFRPTDSGIQNDVTKVGEEALVKFLMSSPGVGLLFNKLGVPSNSFFACSVREPVRKSVHHPDFDLIICPYGQPNLATAIQCKRVKVSA